MNTKQVKGLAALILGLALFVPVTALAQTAENQQQYVVKAGAYNLTVVFYSQLIKTETDVPMSITLAPQGGSTPFDNKNTTLTLVAEPGRDVSATAVKHRVEPDSADASRWSGKVNIPIAGNWSLKITANGPAGTATASVPFVVAPPPVMPEWLAWSIGLSPLIWFLAFFSVQFVQNRKRFNAELA